MSANDSSVNENMATANSLAITIGCILLAALLVWKGDTPHAMACLALAIPNGQQLFGLRRSTTQAIQAAVTQAMTNPPPPLPPEVKP